MISNLRLVLCHDLWQLGEATSHHARGSISSSDFMEKLRAFESYYTIYELGLEIKFMFV